MYEINGICLDGSEYRLLKRLVDKYDHDDSGWDGTVERFDPDYASGRIDEAFSRLLELGLIEGKMTDSRIRVTGFPQRGLDFVHDYESREAERLRLKKEQHRHDFRVAIIGAVAGAIAGAIFGLIGGCLSSGFMAWLQTIAP